MLKQFKAHIKNTHLFSSEEYILIAVSGGVDSVVMCELFFRAKFRFAIAHCNFQLRGKESDGDESFVQNLALKYNVPFFSKKFNTKIISKKESVSIQMAARAIRYECFDELRKKHNFTYIATAHHQDDSTETFFINLIRGTGIAGLHGILPKQGKIIRPLLFATKAELSKFAASEKIAFREDSSNSSDKYLRNRIRHHVIPLLKELNPNFEFGILENINRLKHVEIIYRAEIENKRSFIVESNDTGATNLSIDKLKELEILSPYLYEFLKPYNFNAATTLEIEKSLNGNSGKQFLSPTHRLIKDRKFLIIEPRTKETFNKSQRGKDEEKILVKKNQKESQVNTFSLQYKILNVDSELSNDIKTASLDLEKLTFPLVIRKWKQGDSFFPLGMKGKKKLSDFFIDKKLPLNQKENTRVLISDNKIAWVIGLRIDDRFKITSKTEKIFFCSIAEAS